MAGGIEQRHSAVFGISPSAVLSVTGRTELCGNHTDHQCGCVIAAAIRRSITAAFSPRADGKCILHTDMGKIDISLSSLSPVESEKGTSAAHVRGVAEYFAAHGLNVCGFNAVVESAIPIGGGLSSSAAFGVLMGKIFNTLANGGAVEPMTAALAAQYAENAHFGKPCGLMDQAACALGGVQLMDFSSPARPAVHALSWPFADDFSIYIINTLSSHADMTDAYAQIARDMQNVGDMLGADRLGHANEAEFMRRLCEIRKAAGERAAMRALHFFGENARVKAMAAAIQAADAAAYARIMRQSAASSELLLQNIFTPAQRDRSLAMGIALARRYLDPIGGVARVHGGGFAGTMQALVPRGAEDGFTRYAEGFFGNGSAVRAL